MTLLTLLRSEASINVARMIFVAVTAAVANALVLAIINVAAGSAGQSHADSIRLAIMFAIVLLTFTFSQRYVMFEASRELERIIHRIRTRLIEAVRTSELPEIDEIGRTHIFTIVSQQVQALSQTCNLLIPSAQMALLVIFTTLYLISLSPTSFILATMFMAIAIVMYLARVKKADRAMEQATQAEFTLTDLLSGVLDGFKEGKLNARRSRALADDVVAASLLAATERTNLQMEFARNYIFTQNVFFLLLGTMVFIVPELSPMTSAVLVKTTTAVLFVIGPIAGVIAAVPTLANANALSARILELEKRLGADRESEEPARDAPRARRAFREIELRDVRFHYAGGSAPFEVGPFNLTIRAGETLFISGGNGSGKSTFMRLLTTLYWPTSGEILVDGELVTHENAQAYRELFSSVFSDFHLFKRLYGIDESVLPEAPLLLETFEVGDKTSVDGDAFSTAALSTGQRKRLALIVAMLEYRPICILDEWAADQDPYFRQRFYKEILPTLQSRGVTVIAVSHDDRYFDVADRRLHMEEGRIVSDTRGPVHA